MVNLDLLLDINKDKIIPLDNLKNSYCGRCVDFKIFDPYNHKYNECEYCNKIKEHNYKVSGRSIDDNFNIHDDKLKNKIDKINDIFKEGKFIDCSIIIDISSGFNLGDYKIYLDRINLLNDDKIIFLDSTELYNNKDFNSYENQRKLILIINKDADLKTIDSVASLLVRRSNNNNSTLILSYLTINNFFKSIVTKDKRKDLVFVY